MPDAVPTCLVLRTLLRLGGWNVYRSCREFLPEPRTRRTLRADRHFVGPPSGIEIDRYSPTSERPTR
jgi:hypothetical protein